MERMEKGKGRKGREAFENEARYTSHANAHPPHRFSVDHEARRVWAHLVDQVARGRHWRQSRWLGKRREEKRRREEKARGEGERRRREEKARGEGERRRRERYDQERVLTCERCARDEE